MEQAAARGQKRTAEVEAWREASRQLQERGRLAWALGEALGQVLDGTGSEVDGDRVGRLEAIVERAVSHAGEQRGPARSPARGGRLVAQSISPLGVPHDRQTLLNPPLGERAWVVVWFSAALRPEPGLTLALGMEGNGRRQVLGLWSGTPEQVRCAEKLAEDLHGRGLGVQGPWLAVTGGERALDQALRGFGNGRVVVAHDQRRVCSDVLAHLPTAERKEARLALARAWDAPDVSTARQALQVLVDGWRENWPGAAARLARSVGSTTAVLALGLRGALAQRLENTASAAYLLECCRQAGRNTPAAVAAELVRRQGGFRRFPEAERLGELRQALESATQALCAAGATS
jgi:hypothetical protein